MNMCCEAGCHCPQQRFSSLPDSLPAMHMEASTVVEARKLEHPVCPYNEVQGILALILLNPCSNFLDFAVMEHGKIHFQSTKPKRQRSA